MRFEREHFNPCKECMSTSASCASGTACDPIKQKLRDYSGIRCTSDGFDCALPVAIDSHTVCSYGCLYCFSDNLVQHRVQVDKPVGQTNLKRIEALFSGNPTNEYDKLFAKALKYDRRNENGYPCPIQLGAITDPLDNIERNQGWFLKFAKLAIKYGQPVRIGTKGNLFLLNDYLDVLKERPEIFWVSYSIITPDDDILHQIDKRAPSATERLQCIKNLRKIGVKTALRLRPMLPGISDSTKKYPLAYKTLIEMAADAGVEAISYETAFLPGMPTGDLKHRWEEIEKITDKPLRQIYYGMGKRQACMRPSYTWVENIMHAVKEVAINNDLTVGVSDPMWKQLTDVGCCCGMKPDDPVFGNWERENATNMLLQSKNTGCEIKLADITPPWSYDAKLQGIISPGVGPPAAWQHRHVMWADKLKSGWNDLAKERSPLHYFQGAIIPIRKDAEGNLVYQYKGLKRMNKTNIPYWIKFPKDEVNS